MEHCLWPAGISAADVNAAEALAAVATCVAAAVANAADAALAVGQHGEGCHLLHVSSCF